MNESDEVSKFRNLASAREDDLWTEGGELPAEVYEMFPWFCGQVVGKWCGEDTILFATEQRWFLSVSDCDEDLRYLGNSAVITLEVLNDDDAINNAPYCDRFQARFVSKPMWQAFNQLRWYMKHEEEIERTKELTNQLLATTTNEKLTSRMLYKIGIWTTCSRLHSQAFWTELFNCHAFTPEAVERQWWPRQFSPEDIQALDDMSYFTKSERRVFLRLHTYTWPKLDSVDAELVLERQVGFETLTSQKMGFMNDCMTRHQMHAPFCMTLWRATREFDSVNPLWAFSISRSVAQAFLCDEGPLHRIDIPAGTPIFPFLVYARRHYKPEGEILVPPEVARKYQTNHAKQQAKQKMW